MAKSQKIIQMEKELAKAKAEEAKNAGFTLVVLNDFEEFEEIKVKANKLSPSDEIMFLELSKKLYSSMDDIENIMKKIEDDETTVEDLLKLSFIIDEPLKVILSILFDVEKEKVTTLPNIDLLLEIIKGAEFIEIKNKTEKAAKELDYMKNK